MPHQLQDSLLPGETLEVGEFLESSNGLYRLYMEPGGYPALYAYTIHTAVPGHTGDFNIRTSLWGGVVLGTDPAARLVFPANGEFRLQDNSGATTWSESALNFDGHALNLPMLGIPNHRFAIRDDGMLIHYVLTSTGNYGVVWPAEYGYSTSRWADYCRPRSYPPNTGTATISVGRIAVDGGSDATLVNHTDRLIGVRDSSQVVGVPRGLPLPIATDAGRVAVTTDEYTFLSLSGPVETPATLPANATRSGDAIARRDHIDQSVNPSGRPVVTVSSNYGLSLSTIHSLPPTSPPYVSLGGAVEQQRRGRSR